MDAKPTTDNPPPSVAIAPAATISTGVTVTAEQWARPRSGGGIVQLPGLAALVETVERDAASRLVIRFAGGDEGSLWAEELRSWLVALGLPSARIGLEPGLPPAPEAIALSETAAKAPVPHALEPAAGRPLPKELRHENRAPQADRLLLELRPRPPR